MKYQWLRSFVVVPLFVVGPAWGQMWTESGDAGSLPGDMQIVEGSGPLAEIAGSTSGADLEDMYLILIDDPNSFEATTDSGVIPGGMATFDTQLFLFDADLGGLGVLANDDCFFGCPNNLSHIFSPATDGTNQNITHPGLYFLAITGFDNDPQSGGGPIFNQFQFNEVSGPDGPGGNQQVGGWSGAGDFGDYVIALQGAQFVEMGYDCFDSSCVLVPFGPMTTLGECESVCCDDGDLCTVDFADPETGDCQNAVVDCDDGNGWTIDSCDPGIGCINELPPPAPFEPGTKHAPPAAPCESGVCPEESEEDWMLDPVYLFSGEYYTRHTDLRIPGRGFDFVWTTMYRAHLGSVTPMGNGWDHGYNLTIEPCGTDMVLFNGNNRFDLHTLQPDGSWTAPEYFHVITQNPDTSLTVTFPNNATWNFNVIDGSPAGGKIDSIVDRNGNTMSFGYTGGLLTTITDTLGRDIDVTYNVDGFVQSVTDFGGRSVTYDYYEDGDAGGSAGDLKSVTTPSVSGLPNGNDFPSGKTTTYTYTTGFADEQLNHDLLTITDPLGQTYLQNIYAHTVDPLDPRFTIDPGNLFYGRIVTQTWGDVGDLLDAFYIQVAPDPVVNNNAVMRVIINDREGHVKEFFYDANNNGVMQREYTGVADADLLTTAVDNRPVGKVRVSDPDFFESRFEFDADGLTTRIIHPNLNEDIFIYDGVNPDRRAQANVVTHTRVAGPAGGDQPTITESFEYDDGFAGCCGTSFVTRHVDGRGNETLHTYDANGNRLQTTHRIPSIVEDFEYNLFGQLTAHVLPDNGSGHRRRDELTYYLAGPQAGYRESLIVDATGFALTTTYEYDFLGRLTRVIDPRGFDTTYVLNDLDQIVLESSAEVVAGGGVRYDKLHYYDANDNLVRVDIENVNDAGATDANTHFTTIQEYDILNEVVRTCTEAGSENVAQTVLDCAGVDSNEFVVTEYEYDANRNRTVVRKGAATDGSDPDNVVLNLFDERDLVFQTVEAPGTAVQSSTQFDYDGNANIVREAQGVEDAPRISVWTYDGYDRMTSVTDPMGNATESHYDANGNLGGDLSPGVPHPFAERLFGEDVDVPGAVGNHRLEERRMTYDALDRRVADVRVFFDTATQTAIGDGASETLYVFSDASQEILRTDDNGHQVVTLYDSANRVSSVTDAAGNVETREYDANSNIVQLTEVERSGLNSPAADETFVTTFEFDGLDRLVGRVDNAGNESTYGYDSRDNRTVEDDAEAHEARYVYDGLSRLIEDTRDMDGDGADGDGTDVVTTQQYDDSSRLIAQADGVGNTTRYAYDSLDRIVAERAADGTITQNGVGLTAGDWLPGATVPDFGGFTSGYDVHHNIIIRVDANGSVVSATYDALDRVTAHGIVVGPGVAGTTTFEQFDYDGLSRVVRVEDDDDVVTREYDSLSNVVTESLNGRTTASTHDGVGNRLTCTYPGNRVITTTYDELDRVKTVADTDGAIAQYDYIGPHRVERREYGNGTRSDFTYDGILPNPVGDSGVREVIRTLHTRIGDGAIIDDRSYTWDRMGNKLTRADDRVGGPQLTHTYEYDALYRMTRVNVTGAALRTTEYAFDSAGNRSTVTGAPDPGAYLLDAGDPTPADAQVNQYTTTPFDTREYDANGNLVAISGIHLYADINGDGVVDLPDVLCVLNVFVGNLVACGVDDADIQPCGGGDGVVSLDDILAAIDAAQGQPTCADDIDVRTLSYDYRNRMVEYRNVTSGDVHTYGYDGLSRRVRRVVDADGVSNGPITTRYEYDGWRVIEELDGNDAVQATYSYGRYVDEALNMVRDGNVFYYHSDDMYNVMALTDVAGNVVERYEYDSYGRPVDNATLAPQLGQPSSVGNPYLFTGRRYDAETALYYYRTRYLDPEAGRFTTRDTIGIWGDSRNLGNGYTYAGNNPWTMVDPSGQLSAKCFIMCMLGLDSTDVDELMRAGLGKIADDIKSGALNQAVRRVAAAGARLARRLGKKKAARLIAKLGAKLVPGIGTASTVASACYCGWKCW